MAANRYASGTTDNITADVGGTITAGDSIYVGKYGVQYSNAAGNDLTAVDLLLLQFLPGWTGDAPSTAPVKVVANQGSTGKVVVNFGGQTLYLQSSSGAGVIYSISGAPANGGVCFLGACTNSFLAWMAGRLQASSAASVDKARVGGSAFAQFLKSGPTMSECICSGRSTVEIGRVATLIEVNDQATVRITEDAVTPTNLYLRGSVPLDYGGGAITNFYAHCGIFDARKLTKPCTITNLYPRGPFEIWLANNGPGLTITNTLEGGLFNPVYRYY